MEYRITESSLKFKAKIPIIKDPLDDDLFEWEEKLLALRKRRGLTDKEMNAIIMNTISYELINRIDAVNTPQENISIIQRIQYTKEYANRLYMELQDIRQENYWSLSDYNNDLGRVINELALCHNWIEEFAISKHQEVFYTNLTTLTRIEMQRLRITEPLEILRYLESTENMLLEQIDQEDYRRNDKCFKCDRPGHKKTECPEGRSESRERNLRDYNDTKRDRYYPNHQESSEERNRNSKEYKSNEGYKPNRDH